MWGGPKPTTEVGEASVRQCGGDEKYEDVRDVRRPLEINQVSKRKKKEQATTHNASPSGFQKTVEWVWESE